ncbi:MAG: hypothetical protein KF853_04185 [Rhodocyclaceae bacterium]|nr:hypothetical protein [Rhodocyclaceae bacterium]
MWAVAGSRCLPPGGASVVSFALAAVSPAAVSVGCCLGADAVALGCLAPSRLSVFAAFGPRGVGACRWSAVAAVSVCAALGARVSWWAGGGLAVPLSARLAARTRAVVGAASSGLLLFPASPASRGSWLAARLALARGLPVVAFPVGFAPGELPALGRGAWQPAPWRGGWRWVPRERGELTHDLQSLFA